MPDQRFCLFDTAFGPVGLAWSERGLTRLQLPEASRSATEKRLGADAERLNRTEAPPSVQAAIELLKRYFDGERVDFAELVLDLGGKGEFDKQIYALARQIGWGQTTTYGELARQAGAPGAAQAVGRAMGHNPLAVIIPGHRVLAASDRIGGFSAYGGTISKERLLALEGVVAGMPLLSWALGN